MEGWSPPHPLCFPDMEVMWMAPALPSQPMLCIFHTVPYGSAYVDREGTRGDIGGKARNERQPTLDRAPAASEVPTESPKPVVIIEPDTQVFRGERLTFRCDIQRGGDTEWTYSWNKNDHTLYSDRTTQEFSISSVRDSDGGKYTCRGRRSDSQSSEISDPVTLSVSEKPKPELTSDLKGAALTGNSVTLNCTLKLQSAGWKFYWNKDTQRTETETETHSYTISSVTVSDGGQYWCRAGKGNPVHYTHYSDALWVNVIESPKPVVIIEPDTLVFRGERVTFRCDIQRGGDTEWTYSWNKNARTLYPYRTTQQFSISSVENDHGGKYTCRGRRSDSQISKTSDPVPLSVSEKPKPELTSDLKGAALTGNSVTLNCTLKLQSAGWKFYWIKDTQSRQTETATHSYTISSVRVSDGGQYKCRAGKGNPVHYTHYSDALWVNVIENPKPVVIIEPDTQVFRGETVTFRCDIQRGGDTEWTYSWNKNDHTLYPYRTTQEFSISSVENDHGGKYTCRGRRSDSQISKTSDPVPLSVSEKPKPKLTSDLKGAALTGNSVTLNCTLKLQSAGWKFYWIKDTQSTETETATPSYTISSVRVSDGGQYWCRAGKGNPVHYTHYSDALWVNVIANPKPVVIIKPDTQVFRGETVTFRCDIQRGGDTEWTYSWNKNDHTLYSDRTTQQFSISSVENYHGGKYTCRGRRSDSQISKTSDPVTLSVSEKPKPELTSDLKGAALTGNSVTLSCTLKLQSAGWKFYWNKDTQRRQTETATHSYTIRSVTVSDSGQYWCRAGKGNPVHYTDYSDALWVNVIENPKPVVIIEPDTQVFRGERVTFRCDIQRGGDTEWTYSWNKNDHTLYSDRTTQEFSISSVENYHGGKYTCRGRRSDSQISKTSDPVTLSVSEKPKPKPKLTSDLKGAALTGNSVTLSCTLKLQSAGWKFYWNKPRQSTETETETHSYTIRSVTVSDRGQYKCRAGRGNPVYYTDYSDALWVNVIESPKPVVTIKPDTQVFRGERVTFRCDIQRGGDTKWTYDWYRGDYTFYPYHTTQEFSISVRNDHGGKYTCRGRRSDSQISETSDPVTLSVSGKPKPTVSVNPQSSVYTGDRVTLSCNLQSTGWTFLWYQDYQQLKPLTSVATVTNTFIVTVSNEGQKYYYCKARRGNYNSEISYPATITVRARPKSVVKVKPAERVFIGETVTFSCEIQTRGSWQYHWYRNNKELSDAAGKKTYTISNVKASDKGDYTCKGTQSSDPKYTQTSDAVTLTVSEKPKPELTSDLKGAALTGNSVTLSCTLKLQSAGWKFYWIKDTQSTETETETHSYFIRSVRVSDGGQYKCRAGRGNPVYYTHYSDALWVNVTGGSPPVSLIISPSRTQHFTADSLSLSCEDQSDSTGWTVRGYTHSETLFDCSSVSGSTCNISSLSTSHTGVYWCQSESGGRSNSVNITVHNGDVILESPVHPVTEGNPLTLRCLIRSKILDSGADFYKNDSILQSQTKGEMTIHTVSKSDEGFYHCKHPERGESPKSWVSVRVSASGSTGVIIGLSSAFVFVILLILLILLLHYKKKRGVEYQTPSAVNQDTNQPADGDNIYENTDIRTTDDSAAEASNMLYSEVVTRNKKQKDAATGPSDVTYADIELKNQKKPKRKQGKSSEAADTVYSDLKQNTDKGP
ncbi:basement membrane-specific heparan sulfate proteoglycan core protein-like [Pangasianodon hypophthalmus]|uniref:basement membrane-specific heparan sulfate proteoglycan core protein-like n=1 Tax=Pangasianodon hypophthalmus TaxID=310915 RepID=UPI002307E920|nr:basement membrane-specific heparan sulfate proteoglycan core protein-like [Pangasianodon hypophthalmus]